MIPVVNATMRPAAGIVGVAAHPLIGLWKSCQSAIAKAEQRNYQYQTRVQDGIDAVKASSPQQRQAVLKKFEEMKKTTKQRQKEYAEAAEREMKELSERQEQREKEEGKNQDKEAPAAGPSGNSSTKESDIDSSLSTSASEITLTDETRPKAQKSRYSQEDVDQAYERDIDMAIQLSLAEQRGYERGLQQQQFNN
jgi:sterol 3beta-glucosyltransferase